MTDRLRSALAEIADRAPVVQVPDETYRRGRRSHRHRIAAGVAALGLVVVGAVTLGTTVRHDTPPIAGGGTRGAVPAQLYGVPERLTLNDGHGRWTGPVESDLAIGTGSVAWWTLGPPVVITASDGAYHLLDLPGFLGNDSDWSGLSPALTLSPDGRSLAYAWSSGRLGDSAGPSGVRVVDLVSGELRSIPLPTDGGGTLVQELAWSPDSRWLAWYGGTTVSDNRLHGSVRGVIDTGSATSRSLPSPRDAATAMGVDNHGRVALLTSNRTLLVDPSGAVRRGPSSLPRPIIVGGYAESQVAFSPDGRMLSLPATGLARSMSTMVVGTGGRLAHPLPADVYPDGAMIVPLGWIDDSRMLAVLDPEGPAPDRVKQRDLVVMTPTRSQGSTFRIVGHADGTVPVSLSVAVDLMTPDRYTADLPAPDWPWSSERKIVMASVLVVGIGLVVWVAAGLTRRRHYRRR